MSQSSSTTGRRFTGDGGFTLIEVIVALVLLGIVATAALYFFLEGTRTSSHLQRAQNAVVLANEAMERAYAVDPQPAPGSGFSRLVAGRTETDVTAAWNQLVALDVDGLDETYPLWDPTPSLSSSEDALVPLQADKRHSNQTYTVTTLVGACFRPSTNVEGDQVCTRLPGVATPPGDDAVPSGMVRLLRVIAVVTWPATAGECPDGTCSYQLSGLVDRSTDLEWNQVLDPVAVDDFEELTRGESRIINVLANDLHGPITSHPVQLVDSPVHGTATVAANGMVTYTAPAEGSGKYTFTYRIRDARGTLSDAATVEITVLPESSNDSFRVLSGTATPLDVTANDAGTPESITLVTEPARGTAIVSGLDVVYTATVETGTDTFQYFYTDASGQESPPATVTVLIENLTVQDHHVIVPVRSSASAEWHDLTPLVFFGNADIEGLGVTVVGPRPAQGQLRVGGAVYTGNSAGSTSARGTTLEFNPERNRIGEYTFGYALSRDDGEPTEVRTVTIQVVPVAGPDALGNVTHNAARNLQIGANDRPSTFGGSTGVTVELGALSSGCGSWVSNQNRLTSGEVRLQAPSLPWNTSSRNCSFTYTLVGTGSLSHLRSETVTATFTLRRN